MNTISNAITKTNQDQIIDEITIMKNSVTLFEMKYGKFMDKNALNSFHLISRSVEKLEKKLVS